MNIFAADIRRQYTDDKEFLPGRPAQAKALCLSGTDADRIAKRLAFLSPQVAETKYLSQSAFSRATLSNAEGERAVNNYNKFNDQHWLSADQYVTYLNHEHSFHFQLS